MFPIFFFIPCLCKLIHLSIIVWLNTLSPPRVVVCVCVIEKESEREERLAFLPRYQKNSCLHQSHINPHYIEGLFAYRMEVEEQRENTTELSFIGFY